MRRALPVSRIGQPAGRALFRASRRTYVTPATDEPIVVVTPQKSHALRNFLLLTTSLTASFYIGSAFLALKNESYHDFFVDNVPFSSSVLQFAEDHDWDELTPGSLLDAAKNAGTGTISAGKGAAEAVQRVVGGMSVEAAVNKTKEGAEAAKEKATQAKDAAVKKAGGAETAPSDNLAKMKEVTAGKVAKAQDATESKMAQAKEAASGAKTTLADKVKLAKEKAKSLQQHVTTAVHKNEDGAGGVLRYQLAQFSEGVQDLIAEAEAALTGNAQPGTSTDGTPTSTSDVLEPELGPELVKNVYSAPLPLGFEPPPGFSRPTPPKAKTAAATSKTGVSADAAPSPLPLVAPAVSELTASEPIIAQLASSIDDLASYLNANPTAAEKARDILSTAQIDLTQLAGRVEQVKEEERQKLETTLDEQAREYNLKLLELEMMAQDKLDGQEQEFREVLDAERQAFAKAYREKLEKELETQSEIINERLKEEVIAQGIELQRRWIREVKVQVENERGGRLAKLDDLSLAVKKLERVALDNGAYLDENLRVHALWSALRSLSAASLDSPERKPFRDELRVVRHFASTRDDEAVSAVLDVLEKTDVPDVGIEPLADLTSWFASSVAPQVARVALVPESGSPGLLSHLASAALSAFQFRRQGLVEGDDVMSVLARAEHFLSEKDLDQAAREVNRLQGTAGVLVSDWLEAARKRLEVMQALEVVQAQATLSSLMVV